MVDRCCHCGAWVGHSLPHRDGVLWTCAECHALMITDDARAPKQTPTQARLASWDGSNFWVILRITPEVYRAEGFLDGSCVALLEAPRGDLSDCRDDIALLASRVVDAAMASIATTPSPRSQPCDPVSRQLVHTRPIGVGGRCDSVSRQLVHTRPIGVGGRCGLFVVCCLAAGHEGACAVVGSRG